MRRINILYLSIPISLYVLLMIYNALNRSTASFYGVAENQETQINLEHAANIDKIYVTQGQFVTKGTLLLEVTRVALELKMSELSHDISEIMSRNLLDQEEINGQLEIKRAERAEKIGEIQSRIHLLETEQAMNKSLFLELQSLPGKDSFDVFNSPYQAQLQLLQTELRLSVEPIEVEIDRLEKMKKITGIPAQTIVSRLKEEVNLYHREEEKLKVYAPSDGLIGGIHCHVAENIPSFKTLISFYEENPNTVVAYLHESLSLQIKVGDSLKVISNLHPDEYCHGRVSGLGHRIIEIPERLRKISEIKTYGREILIQIPSGNNFLQKEKVVLQRLNPTSSSIFTLFHQPFSSNAMSR